MNIATNTMKKGPSLNEARHRHGCTLTRDDSIIVTGGKYKARMTSTEVLMIKGRKWTNGLHLKERIRSNRIVESKGKDYIAYSIGGETVPYFRPTSKIYGLSRNTTEGRLVANLNKPRWLGSAVNVPPNMIPWCFV